MLPLLLVVASLSAGIAHGAEVEGVKLDDKTRIDGAQELVLNGAGVRSKMFVKGYVGALYLAQKKSAADAVLADKGQKRVALHILRDDVPADKMLSGLKEGLADNNSQAEMTALDARIKDFGSMLSAVKVYNKGNVIAFDFLAASTRVSINGEAKGTIPGEDFSRALLKVWLGEKPVDSSLKKGMLGG
jgi:long-chain acyl-CoA synthetase